MGLRIALAEEAAAVVGGLGHKCGSKRRAVVLSMEGPEPAVGLVSKKWYLCADAAPPYWPGKPGHGWLLEKPPVRSTQAALRVGQHACCPR